MARLNEELYKQLYKVTNLMLRTNYIFRAAERIKRDFYLNDAEKTKRLRELKMELMMELPFRRQARLMTSAEEQELAVLPKSLVIGVGRFVHEAALSTQTPTQWLEAIRTIDICEWKSTQLDIQWTAPVTSQFAYEDKSKIVFIRLFKPIDSKTLVWFDKYDFINLQHPYENYI